MNVAYLSEALDVSPPEFREAFEWFESVRGQVIPYPSPSPIPSLEHVVTRPKGIFKPKGFEAALSIRIMLDSPYADLEPEYRDDGTWVCKYHQENPDPYLRDSDWTNVAMLVNARDGIPIILLQQLSKGPSRYLVHGPAVVAGWDAGYFYLEGFNSEGIARNDFDATVLEADTSNVDIPDAVVAPNETFDFAIDARKRVTASLIRRQGGGPFRKALLAAYEGQCVISGCGVEQVLDAAHIRPYRGPHTNSTQNGLLLRTDLHALWDRGLLAVHPHSRLVIVADSLLNSEYSEFIGKRLREPIATSDRPSSELLEAHLDWTRVGQI